MGTAIQWTDETDNIIVVEGGGWWCRMISPGCANCYAAKLNQSEFFGGNKLAYSGEPPKLVLREDVIDGWKRQRIPRKHFVASMTDVFGDWVPYGMALRFLRGMWCAPKQTFQVLTKRPDIARAHIERWLRDDGLVELPRNIWLGVSVEDQARADERIPILLQIPAKVRFVSYEPALAAVDFHLCKSGIQHRDDFTGNPDHPTWMDQVDWIIVGGESGPKARPFNIGWARSTVGQCKAAGVACFVKQMGAQCYWHDPGATSEYDIAGGLLELKDRKGGDLAEWPEDLRVREFPANAQLSGANNPKDSQ